MVFVRYGHRGADVRTGLEAAYEQAIGAGRLFTSAETVAESSAGV
jgi:hypothetical protein